MWECSPLINGSFAWRWSHCFHYHKSILDSIELSVPDGPERRTTAFVQNMFNFIVYINWLLVLYAQSKPPCLLRYSLTQLQRALAGGSLLRQIFWACTSSEYVLPPLSADSQSTGCTGEEALLWFCTVPGPTRLKGFILSFEKRYFWPQL